MITPSQTILVSILQEIDDRIARMEADIIRYRLQLDQSVNRHLIADTYTRIAEAGAIRRIIANNLTRSRIQ
jgi:hypothetical protein